MQAKEFGIERQVRKLKKYPIKLKWRPSDLVMLLVALMAPWFWTTNRAVLNVNDKTVFWLCHYPVAYLDGNWSKTQRSIQGNYIYGKSQWRFLKNVISFLSDLSANSNFNNLIHKIIIIIYRALHFLKSQPWSQT